MTPGSMSSTPKIPEISMVFRKGPDSFRAKLILFAPSKGEMRWARFGTTTLK